ncbi:MAG TPA: hypothetical protein VGK10_04360 [Prolixibacteraceae bacterium]|jgi:hypothetical protein
MKKTLTNIKEGNRPTIVQMKLLHWLTQLELSEGSVGDGSNRALGAIKNSPGDQISGKK